MDEEDKQEIREKAQEFIEDCLENGMIAVLIAGNEETGSFRMSTIDADPLDTMNLLLTAAKVMGELDAADREGRTLN